MMRMRREWLCLAPSLGLAIGCANIDAQFGSPPIQVRAQSPEIISTQPRPASPLVSSPPAVTVTVCKCRSTPFMQLAECQNASLRLACERVKQAYAEQDLAAKSWIPDISVGAGYYRHEGGIQLQEGPLIKSSTGAAIAGLDAAVPHRSQGRRVRQARRRPQAQAAAG